MERGEGWGGGGGKGGRGVKRVEAGGEGWKGEEEGGRGVEMGGVGGEGWKFWGGGGGRGRYLFQEQNTTRSSVTSKLQYLYHSVKQYFLKTIFWGFYCFVLFAL